MTTAQRGPINETEPPMVPLSVEQYHRMIETGILREGAPIELLEGFLYRKDRSAAGADPMTVGNEHVKVVKALEWFLGGAQEGWHYCTQQPITILPDSEPEPDGSILRGTPFDYTGKGTPADVSCIIEVSDSSLRHDRVKKLKIYAGTNIPQYVVVNLVGRVVEVYTEPVAGSGSYEKIEPIHKGQTLELLLPTGTYFDLPVDKILA